MPLFNRHEAQLTVELSPGDKRELSRLLRTVLRTLDDELSGDGVSSGD